MYEYRNSTEGDQIKPVSIGLWSLATLAVIQGSILIINGGRQGQEDGDAWLRDGDDLSHVQATAANGAPAALASGEPLLLLVFDPECGHCRDVVPEWSDWVQSAEPGIRVVAVALARQDAASAFLSTYLWEPELWILGPEDGTPGRRPITTRTPWMFLLDGHGVILYEGHGQRIRDLGSEWAEVLQVRATQP